MSARKVILEKFKSGELECKGYKAIFKTLDITSSFEKDAVRAIIDDLEKCGEIVYIDGMFVLKENSPYIEGTLQGNRRGFAFLLPCDKNLQDLFIPSKNLHGGLNGDRVLVKRVNSKDSDDEGEVVKILERGIKKLVGTYKAESTYGFVIPDDGNYFCDVFIPFKSSLNAKSGDKVYCEITEFSLDRRNPEGKILEVLGRQFDLKTEELSIIKNRNLPLDFPDKVLSEVRKIPDELRKKDYESREDYTSDMIITIDGDDSRDFDDAYSLVKKNNGNYLLSVHIADVSHYVQRGTPVDLEAYNRGTSVYFPERVIPMLPEKLSNGICSINEGVDRLALSCIMEIDGNGEVVDSKIVESVIRSKHRLTYNKAQKILDGEENLRKEYFDVVDMLELSKELEGVLFAKRKKRGNIDLDVKECQISVDEKGDIELGARKNLLSYKIIEEFMILTNETVAEYATYLTLPFLYRIHEKPNAEKVETFKNFVKLLGVSVKWKDTVYSKDFQSLLEKIEGEPYFSVVNRVMLRSLQKAKYSPENAGHFGLSSTCYCHFTSPIRRYPDLVIHSIIKSSLHGKLDDLEYYENFVAEASEKSSERERFADEVEREMDDFYKCRYMRRHIGEEYDGVISGVTNFGIFVELENTVEGLIKIELLPGKGYSFDDKSFTLTSGKFKFCLGEEVRIKVLGVDSSAKRVEFALLEW